VDGDLRFDDPADGTGHIGFGGLEWMRADDRPRACHPWIDPGVQRQG
jgi:hypothetical protein